MSKKAFIGPHKIKFKEIDRLPIDTLIKKMILLRREYKESGTELILDFPVEMDLEFLRYRVEKGGAIIGAEKKTRP